MKLLYYLHTLSIGGSQRSSLALAKEMRKRGHDVAFAGEVQGDAYVEVLRAEGFKHFDMRFSRKPADIRWITRRLSKLCSEEKVDICHAYYYTNYYFAWLASLQYKMPLIGGTFCGGPGPRYHIPRLSPVVVFSEEQKDAFITKWGWKREDIIVSPGRVEPTEDSVTAYDKRELLVQSGLSGEFLTILFVSRLSEDKRKSVEAIMQLAEEISTRNFPWQVLVAGGGELESMVRAYCEELRARAGRPVMAAVGEQKNLDYYYASADAVAGIGRSIFDGMMRGKPALVVGENGFAGVVSPENTTELSYYNFSGRNTAIGANANAMASAIASIAEQTERERLGSYARNYALENLSVEAGGNALLDYYERLRAHKRPPRHKVLRDVALSTISYIRRKGLHA